jgi:putative FmdB family regulatory protein
MPLYEYRCQECQATTEFLLKFSDPSPEDCPKCQKKHSLQKILSKSGFVLKGGGWYTDAYASKPPAETKAVESAPAPNEAAPATPVAKEVKPEKGKKTE